MVKILKRLQLFKCGICYWGYITIYTEFVIELELFSGHKVGVVQLGNLTPEIPPLPPIKAIPFLAFLIGQFD